MLPIKLKNLSPFVVFVLAAISFVAWIAYDSSSPAPGAPLAMHPIEKTEGCDIPSPHGISMDVLMSGIHPGMPRPILERHLVTLAPPQVDRVDLSSGVPLLRSHYRVHLMQRIPRLMSDRSSSKFHPGFYELTVEFNGAQHNNPLLRAELSPVHVQPENNPHCLAE